MIRSLAIDCHFLAEIDIPDDNCPAANAKCVGDAGDDEDQSDIRVAQHVPECVETTITQPIGDGDRAFVQHFDEAGRITFWRDIEHATFSRRGDENKGRVRNEAARDIVNDAYDLVYGTLLWLPDNCAELILRRHDIAKALSQFHVICLHARLPAFSNPSYAIIGAC